LASVVKYKHFVFGILPCAGKLGPIYITYIIYIVQSHI